MRNVNHDFGEDVEVRPANGKFEPQFTRKRGDKRNVSETCSFNELTMI